MNRIKMFLIAVISVLVIFVLANDTQAATKKLKSDGTLYVSSTRAMYKMTNVFCVEHGQNCGKTTYKIKASIHIRGRQITLKRWKGDDYENGTPSYTSVYDAYTNPDREIQVSTDGSTVKLSTLGYRSNVLAAIFYTSGLKSGGNDGFGTVTGRQLTLWWYWNTWVNALPNDGSGGLWNWGDDVIKRGSQNQTLVKSDGYKDEAEYNMKKVYANAKANDYSIDLYYLDCSTSSWQALVLFEKPTDETIDIPIEKVWDDGSNRDGKRPDSIYVELYKNGTATGNKKLLNANNHWSSTFYNLAKKDSSGKIINYTVHETRNKCNQS